MARTTQPRTVGFPWQQTTLLFVGALYLVGGIVGFFFLGDVVTDLTGRDTGHGPLGLELNDIQNFLHIAIGLAALASTSNPVATRAGGLGLVAACAGLAAFWVIGLFWPAGNLISANLGTTIVHALTAVVGGVIVAARTPPDDRSD